MFGSPRCGYHSCLTAHFPTDGTSSRHSKRTNHGLFNANGTLIGLFFDPLPSPPPLPFSFQDLRVGECLRWGLHGETTGTWNQSATPPTFPIFFFVIIIPLPDCAHARSTNDCASFPGPHTQIITHTVVYSAPENYRDSLAPPPPLHPRVCMAEESRRRAEQELGYAGEPFVI